MDTIVKNELVLNVSMALLLASIFIIVFSEDYREDEIQKQRIRIPCIVMGQILLAFAVGLGRLATERQIYLVPGSPNILMSWNPNSPSHDRESFESKSESQGRFKWTHYKRYLGYIRCITIFEWITHLVSVFWTVEILLLNVGDSEEKDKDRWCLDKNSLFTTLMVTFSIVICLVIVQFVV